MSINIKNAAAEQALRELTALTGETQAAAVERAARERTARLTREARRGGVAERVLQAQRVVRETGGPLSTTSLYDAVGLPA